jgi:hypothetical protein
LAILSKGNESSLEVFDFLTTTCCLLLKTLDGLLEIEDGLVRTEETRFKVCDVLRRIGFRFLVLNDLPLERAN